jgi:hypothetical protein
VDHLDTAYKLGSAKAMEQFTDWMNQDGDEKAASAMERLAEKLGGRKKKKTKPAPKSRKGQRAVRAPGGKGTRFGRLKSKLKRTKKAAAPAWMTLNKQVLGTPMPKKQLDLKMQAPKGRVAPAAPAPAPAAAPALHRGVTGGASRAGRQALDAAGI